MTILCPHCKREFRPPPWMQTLEAGTDYVLTCPHCGERYRFVVSAIHLVKEAK